MTPTVPTRQVDLLAITLGHRAMCADARRLADLAARLVTGEERLDRPRGAALARWIDRLADEIHHHHEAEDDVLWPVLERWARDRVDLAALTDDHAALEPLLARCGPPPRPSWRSRPGTCPGTPRPDASPNASGPSPTCWASTSPAPAPRREAGLRRRDALTVSGVR
jgi:hypothetical protein